MTEDHAGYVGLTRVPSDTARVVELSLHAVDPIGTTADALEIPRVPASLVPRPSLMRRLDRLAALTIVEALPGFGKTTVVASWATEQRDRGAHVLWLRGSEDTGTHEMLDELRDGLRQAGVIGAAATKPRDRGGTTTRPAWVDELALVSTPVIVVIEDAHLARDSAVAEALIAIVRIAHAVHLVAQCAGVHPFHEAAARYDVETNVLRGGDLCIPPEEVATFAAAWGHHVDRDAARHLHQLVGGWLLPLRLVLDATPPWSDTFATHVAHEFLMHEVLADLVETEDVDAAMRLAVPARVDVDLAQALVTPGGPASPRSDAGEATIARLQHHGLLWRIPSDDGLAQWRFPNLVRRALVEELGIRHRDAAATANGTAARALVARDPRANLSAIVEHARAAGGWSLLAGMWSKHGWALLGSDVEAFRRGYAAIPATERKGPLMLAAALGDALAVTSDDADWIQRSETLMRHYAQAGSHALNGTPASDPAVRSELLTAGMVALRMDGRFDESRAVADAVAAAIAEARAVDPAGTSPSQAAWATLQAAITQFTSGDLGATHELAIASHEAAPTSLVGAGAAALLSVMHAASGDRVEASRWLGAHESVDLTGFWAADLAGLPARLARAMLAMDRLDRDAAAAALEDTSLSSDANGMWPIVLTAQTRFALLFGEPVTMLARTDHLAMVVERHLRSGTGMGRQIFDRCVAELLLATGEADRARQGLDSGGAVPSWLFVPAARFHLITGAAQRAARMARTCSWRPEVPARDRMELLMISALAHRQGGDTERAVEDIRHAHALGCHIGNLEPYLHLPENIRRELLAAAGVELDADAQQRLSTARRVYPEAAEVTRLTPRELIVVREMGRHETAAGIAKALSVSVNTVKKQMVSAYGKLGVHDRRSALLRARQLGFLDEDPAPSG